MTVRKAVTGILAVFVVMTVVMTICQMHEDIAATPEEPAEVAQTGMGDADVVYYFMTSQRCQNCMNIESYTREAVERAYAGEMAGKSLIWTMVNVDEPENRHFITDYQLVTKSVVLVRYRNGIPLKWKNLDAVWTLLGDKMAFQEYIINEVGDFLGQS